MTYDELLLIPHFTVEHLKLRCKDGSPLPADVVDAANKYGASFAAPQLSCLGCGDLLVDPTFPGMGTFEWGIRTGEGHCARCRYPYRAQHYIEDVCRFEMVLGYHPSLLADMSQLRSILEDLGIEYPNVPSAWAQTTMEKETVKAASDAQQIQGREN